MRLTHRGIAKTFLFAVLTATLAGGVRPALAQNAGGITEIVPTAQGEPVPWKYTLDRQNGNDWKNVNFNDGGWKQSNAPFANDGTPGVRIGTKWTTADIWIRREAELPANPADIASLQLYVFHDEDAEVYINGVLAARERGFNSNYEPIELLPDAKKELKPGAKILIAVHCHQTTGGQGIDVGLAKVPAGYASESATARRKNRYRDYAMGHPGDIAAGKVLFNNVAKLACTNCHTIDGKGDKAGPDLMTIGDKFSRRELVENVMSPSAQIAIGFTTTIIRTKGGDTFTGIIKETSDAQVGIMGADAKMVHIKVPDIDRQQTTNVSLMPEALESGLSYDEFTDVISYLSSLRVPETAQIARQGMPATIPLAEKLVSIEPISSPENQFTHPAWVGQIPGQPDKFLVSEHETGKIWLLDKSNGNESKSLFLDYRSEIRPGGATGLLGIAFHPQFKQNHKYYIQHERQEGRQIYALISERIAADDFSKDAGQSSKTVIEFKCSTDVHSGGGITFGPDGMLYIGMGDTGPQGDPEGHGQNLTLPLGKMLRIDVDHVDAGKNYGIPKDNPFANDPNARPEIWAYGFREPWRYSFDSATGDLWVGDVGQDRIEEVDIVRRGENYGWNVYEGFELFSNKNRKPDAKYVNPVFAYNRKYGNSITGGYVYHGKKAPSFDGVYICGDYTSKRIWAITQKDRVLTSIKQIATCPQSISSFGTDDAGEIYAVGYEGTIYHIDLSTAAFETKGQK